MLQLFQIRVLAEERLEFWRCCFLFLRQEHVHFNLFLQKKMCIIDYLNRCKVLYAYVDITVLVRLKILLG